LRHIRKCGVEQKLLLTQFILRVPIAYCTNETHADYDGSDPGNNKGK
jgi:hypothetical protein